MLQFELCRYEDHTITARIAAALVVARIDFDYRGEPGEDAAIFVRPQDRKQAEYELNGARYVSASTVTETPIDSRFERVVKP